MNSANISTILPALSSSTSMTDDSNSKISNTATPTTGSTSANDLPAPATGPSFADTIVNFFAPKNRQTLFGGKDADGNAVIRTSDGFQIKLGGKNQDITILSPEGHETKIWGDPHVEESDGGKWDFHRKSSFMFGKNKISLSTTPYGDSGATVVKKMTIYNGDQRITIDDIDTNKPRMLAYSYDAHAHDKALQDGDQYRLGASENGQFGWTLFKSKGVKRS